ncbi:MAG: hypothetical protein OEY19_07950 [Gammaproteobacteria bacterium]|nr:hypothetical protein [Gammaproteobacteria bacterium]MDH5631273.1 hypothetical protein [Gammaproteobacteria bacterium]
MKKLILILLLLIGTVVNAENIPSQVDLNIKSVITKGRWSEENFNSEYRFILYQYGYEHVRGKIWIQWLQWEFDSDGISTQKKLVSEMPIAELNKLGYSLAIPECMENWKCPYFEIKAYSTFESVPNKKFKLTPIEPGKYKIEEIPWK